MVEEREMWDSHWSKGAFHYQHHRALVGACQRVLGSNLRGAKVLEVGFGRGSDSVRLAQLGANVYMIDFSTPAVSLALKLAQQRGVRVRPILANAESLPFLDNSFDLVFSQGVMEHGDNTQLLREQARVVRSGGFVAIDVPQLLSIQAIAKWVQIKIGSWPYGDEQSFTPSQVSTMLKEVGLQPTTSYGWGLVPMLHLGIRGMLKRSEEFRVRTTFTTVSELPEISNGWDLRDYFEQSPFAPWILNNVGVIAKKL